MKNSIFRKKIAYLLATAVISGGLSGVVNVDLYASTIENNKASSITDNMGLDRTTPSTIISQVADILTIAEVRAAKEGEAVKTKGVVTRVNGKNIYIEDETAGMYVYGEADNKVKEGDEIIVSGNLKNYNGLLEIVAPKNEKIIVTTLSNNNVTTPQVITIKEYTDNTDKYESRLIRIAGITLGDIQTSGYTTMEDHTGESEIYKAPKGIQEGYDKYDVIGVGARYNNRFYLTVVDAADIIPTDGMLGVEDIIIKVGETFTLPQTIEVLKDGIATNEKITWNQVEVDAIDNSKSGIYEVNGIVEANHRAVKVAVGIASNEQIRISDIQGESHQSPLINQPVADVEGIVTIVEDEGFYMQSETPDDDDATSEGIYVAKQGVNVQVGKVVKVSGIVEEEISPSTNANMVPEVQLTTTQITANKVEVLDTKVNEIKPIIIGEGGRVAPNKIIDNDAFEKFDPEEDAIDFYESLEGMLVQVNNALVVGANKYDE
ncbi:MAG: Ig-like domain-containing protein, partial [Cellulosilyticaceae bacterium]